MKIAIVDDSAEDRTVLIEYFKKYNERNNTECEIREFASADSFLAELENGSTKFDMVIMDIDMPGKSGIEAARITRDQDERIVLMFVTNMPQYAMVGYEVEAVDYVLKPVTYENFELKMTKALRYIRRNRIMKITLHTAEGTEILAISDIYFVESVLHYLIFHSRRGDFKIRCTMSQIESTLADYQFAKCNSGYLVNLSYVEAIKKDDVIVAGVPLKISRGKKHSFINSFTKYLGGFME